jgi:osmoprotectant transport system substrate-binding protein
MLTVRLPLCTAMVLASLLLSCAPSRESIVVIGSKNFTEQLILGEMFAQEIAARTRLQVERRFYLAGTFICQQAILAGRIDIYPEYTGTALTAVLKEKPEGTASTVYQRVKAEYARRFHLAVGQPLGFDDTFAIEIRGEDARRLQIQAISQAAQYAPQWRPGFGYEFMERSDGYKGLVTTYGLRFRDEPRVMDLGLLNRALKEKQVDLIAGNTTDGVIMAFDFFVLQDDKHYFPPYEAVPIIRNEVLSRHPELLQAIGALSSQVTAEEMRELNFAVDGQHRDATQVVSEFLRRKGLI